MATALHMIKYNVN